MPSRARDGRAPLPAGLANQGGVRQSCARDGSARADHSLPLKSPLEAADNMAGVRKRKLIKDPEWPKDGVPTDPAAA